MTEPRKYSDRRLQKADYRRRHPGIWIKYQNAWRNKDPEHAKAIQMVNLARRRAIKMCVDFSLVLSDIERRVKNGVCEVTGIPFVIPIGGGRTAWTPSLDRIDHNGGYTPENVRVTVTIFNLARNSFSDSDVKALAYAIVKKGQS